jgi:hypothetical protein
MTTSVTPVAGLTGTNGSSFTDGSTGSNGFNNRGFTEVNGYTGINWFMGTDMSVGMNQLAVTDHTLGSHQETQSQEMTGQEVLDELSQYEESGWWLDFADKDNSDGMCENHVTM